MLLQQAGAEKVGFLTDPPDIPAGRRPIAVLAAVARRHALTLTLSMLLHGARWRSCCWRWIRALASPCREPSAAGASRPRWSIQDGVIDARRRAAAKREQERARQAQQERGGASRGASGAARGASSASRTRSSSEKRSRSGAGARAGSASRSGTRPQGKAESRAAAQARRGAEGAPRTRRSARQTRSASSAQTSEAELAPADGRGGRARSRGRDCGLARSVRGA